MEKEMGNDTKQEQSNCLKFFKILEAQKHTTSIAKIW